MPYRLLSVSTILGLLVALPACAEEKDEQVIGPPASIGCCWGDAPSADPASVEVSGSTQIGAFPNAGSMN